MRRLISVFLFVLISVAACNTPKASTDKTAKKKIVLIPGNDSHGLGEHEHLGGCQLLAELLNKHVPEVEAIVTEQGWPSDTTVLDDAAAILMYCDGGNGHMVIPHIDHMEKLMQKGVGLMNLHYGVEITKGEFGNRFMDWVGGYFETHWSVNPFWTASFTEFPNHPITRGVQPFEAHDEWYYHMRFTEDQDNLVHILRALPPPSTLERPDGPHSNNEHVRNAILEKKEIQTTAWAYTRKNGGRGVGFTGAHVHNNWKVDDFRKLVLNALVWIAKAEVPADGIQTPTPSQDKLDGLRKKPK